MMSKSAFLYLELQTRKDRNEQIEYLDFILGLERKHALNQVKEIVEKEEHLQFICQECGEDFRNASRNECFNCNKERIDSLDEVSFNAIKTVLNNIKQKLGEL